MLVVLCFQFHILYLNLKIVVISFKYIGILNILNITIWTTSSVVIWHHNKVTFLSKMSYCSFFLKQTLPIWKPGGELLPCMSYIVMCGLKGYRRHRDLRCWCFLNVVMPWINSHFPMLRWSQTLRGTMFVFFTLRCSVEWNYLLY